MIRSQRTLRWTLSGCLLSLAVGAAVGCEHDDACSVMPDPPIPAIGTPDPCRYWLAPALEGEVHCPSDVHWNGAPLISSEGINPTHCRYEWSDPDTAPTAADVAPLPMMGWTQGCTYVTRQGAADSVTLWARQALRDAVGEKLPSSGQIDVGVVVLDTVPEGQGPPPEEARHGQTLARMIADLTCATPGDCPVEVRNAMAMPMVLNSQRQPVPSLTGGSFGLLSDVSNALWAEAKRYRDDLRFVARGMKSARFVPARVVVVSAFGFENEPGSSLCDTSPATSSNLAVVAMHEAFEASACLGMMHVSSAGNSNGGAQPQGGLLCPARWDHAVRPTEDRCAKLWGESEWEMIKTDYATYVNSRTLGSAANLFLPQSVRTEPDALLSVAGVDYNGSPLVLSRPDACAEAVAIGIGGIGWQDDQDVPSALFGSSVSAAVAGARLALRWHKDLDLTATDLLALTTTENRKIPFASPSSCDGAPALSCPDPIPWIGEPTAPISGQNPVMPDTERNALRLRPNATPILPPGEAVCAAKIPHCVRPSVASTTLVWPQPVEPICVKCGLFADPGSSSGYPELWLDANSTLAAQNIVSAVLIIEDGSKHVVLTKPLDAATLTHGSTTVALVNVRASLLQNARAWISVYTASGRTLSQQIYVTN